MYKLIILLILSNGFLNITFSQGNSSKNTPIIILIWTDDRCWNGLSTKMDSNYMDSKSDFSQTQILEKLARRCIRFSNGYAPAPVCSPTRNSIQFGISPAITRVTQNSTDFIQMCEPEQELPNIIKKGVKRYATGHFDKWFVSLSQEACGYDVSDGPMGNGDGNKSERLDDPKRSYKVSSRAVLFMEQKVKSKQPFFILVSNFEEHLYFLYSQDMKKKYMVLPLGEKHSDPIFAGIYKDLGVGILFGAIDDLEISDNTFLIYLLENGFDESESKLQGIAQHKAWPLTYSKVFDFEGGVRFSFIVLGPGIKAGTFSSVPLVGYDLMSTFLELIDPDFKLPKMAEGGSMVPVLINLQVGRVNRSNKIMEFHYPTGAWLAQTSII
ncbi:sulfatase-like hydrolase/transferase [Arenibacter palladensis]|uniref:sulfatase-like hydrolase/transferase n=1 Tax=Arenibacter palladensis TaxID=237373 RepID=UPI0026E116A9|nr:sulfatase-like hydrolase/transferase [Arenibacter palladensis]MDO6602850.1 sulfatase-like hydrolase/transferase [Arenibacter palladensis]